MENAYTATVTLPLPVPAGNMIVAGIDVLRELYRQNCVEADFAHRLKTAELVAKNASDKEFFFEVVRVLNEASQNILVASEMFRIRMAGGQE